MNITKEELETISYWYRSMDRFRIFEVENDKLLIKKINEEINNNENIESSEEKTFTLEQIETAILKCPVYKNIVKSKPYIDGDFDRKIETIETKMFLYKLNKTK